MSAERYEFGIAERIEADAVGVPGQRRFRLLVEGATGIACLWMEKEQLQALAMAIDQITAGMPILWSGTAAEGTPDTPATPFAQPAFELTVGRLALGIDEASKRFVVQAHDIESDLEGEATFRCSVSRNQLRSLGSRINAIVSAGRPRCPLCGTPLEGVAHVCAGQNGHAH